MRQQPTILVTKKISDKDLKRFEAKGIKVLVIIK